MGAYIHEQPGYSRNGRAVEHETATTSGLERRSSETGLIDSPLLRPHVPALDGKRGLAILAIMVLHFGDLCGQATAAQRAWHALISPLWMGVDLFFVLSGFLITRILLSTKGKPRFFFNFYGRRTVRIFPLYYGVLLGIFVLLPLIRPGRPTPELRAQQIWFWTYLSNFRMAWTGQLWATDTVRVNHFWSLAVEEQFYLVWPTLVYLMDRRWLRRMCLAVIAAAPVARAVAILGFQVRWAVVFGTTPFRMDTLCYGALIAVLAQDAKALQRVRRWAPLAVALCLAGLACVFAARGDLDSGQRSIQISAYTLTGPLFAGLILWTLAKPGPTRLSRAFEARWLTLLGKYSYGLYVLHYLLMPQFQHIFSLIDPRASGELGLVQTLAFEALAMACSLVIAILSYHFYEAQFLKIKRYFSSRNSAEIPSPVGVSGPLAAGSE
jgi:peptidoglycan/LPS O-acetylase OafA/YrhL